MPYNKQAEFTDSEERLHKAAEDASFYGSLLSASAEVEEARGLLSEQRAPTFQNIKDSCVFELQRFINMRGSVDSTSGEVHPSLSEIMDQNTNSTIKKIKAAGTLINSLSEAKSVEELNVILHNTPSAGVDLDVVISNCLLITGVVADQKPQLG